jgi:hypothetical protein
MIQFTPFLRAILILVLAVSSVCWGASGPALIVNDGAPGITADVVTNLSGKLTTAGYTVSTNVGVPGGSLSAYRQIWDVRYNNPTPLTPSDIAAYVAYLAGGGSLFVMGENMGFATRNNSIVGLIQSAGGGTVTVNTGDNIQTVQAPFTGPTSVTTVTFQAAAATRPAPGSGAYITKDGSNLGAAIVFGPGSLSAATAGTLIVVFDVNFLQAGATAPLQALTDNLIGYLAAPAPIPAATPLQSSVPAPTLSQWAMILLAFGFTFIAARRLRTSRGAA